MLRAGVIGLGVGEAHIKGYNSHPDCEVVAICDFDASVLKKIAPNYQGVKATIEPNEVLTDPAIDVVTIASYDNFHYEQILTALAHDKHIFVEKPLCLYEKEAIDIYQTLEAKPHLKISSNLILRKSERFIQLKEWIQNQKLGELYYIMGAYNYGRIHKIVNGWRGQLDFYSIIYGGGVHIIDLLIWLTESQIVEVTAYGNKVVTKDSQFANFDLVESMLKFDNGMIGRMCANFGCVHPHFHQLEVYGTDATFINRIGAAEWYDVKGKVPPKLINTAYPGTHKGDLLNNFIDAILLDKEPQTSRNDVFDAMCVCFAIEKSAHTGQSVKVNYIHRN